MKRARLGPILLAMAMCASLGCGASEDGDSSGGESVPPLMRARFTSELQTMLRQLQVAEEQAAAIEGRYLPLEELRGRYFTSPVREGLELTLSDVSGEGYRATLVHRASGIRCRLEVSESTSGTTRCE